MMAPKNSLCASAPLREPKPYPMAITALGYKALGIEKPAPSFAPFPFMDHPTCAAWMEAARG